MRNDFRRNRRRKRVTGSKADHDLAYESGYAEAHFLNGVVRKGRFSTVWKRQSDGQWKGNVLAHLAAKSAPEKANAAPPSFRDTLQATLSKVD